MGWRCVWVRRQLPLYVGEDLTERDQSCVETHLRVCHPCRNHMESLRRSRQAMIDCRSIASDKEIVPSVWPALKLCLNERSSTKSTSATWLSVGALLAASIAIGVVIWNRPTHVQPLAGFEMGPGSLSANVDWEPAWTAGLASPAVQIPSEFDRMPERFMRPGTRFYLEGAIPFRASTGDF